MGKAFQSGMVLAMSIWDDPESDMLWMDAKLPVDRDVSIPGVTRGPCTGGSNISKRYSLKTRLISCTCSIRVSGYPRV